MITSVVILLILTLGKFNASGPGAQYDADIFTLGVAQGLKIQSGVFGCLLRSEQGHRNGPLYAVFIFFREVAIEIEIFNLGCDFAGELRCIEKGYRPGAA